MNDTLQTPGPADDLRYVDLGQYPRLLPEHLAGRDLTGAKLPFPHEIPKYFLALGQVNAISGEARKIFIGLLAACVYSWLVIGTTTDVALILNTASSPLPIINTAIPIAGFYVIGATILAAVYCYLHFYLQRLWRTLATLPAIFPDGTALDDRTDPWLLTNLVRVESKILRTNLPPLVPLENLLSIVLAWWLAPFTLLLLWERYLPAHDWFGTTWLVLMVFVTTIFGHHTYRLAHAVLRGGPSTSQAAEEDRDGGILARAWREFHRLCVGDLTMCLTIALTVMSYSAFVLSPRETGTIPWALNLVGIRTYADLRDADVAQRPNDWDGKDLSKIKQVDLRGRNLAFAEATRAFLAKVDLRGANLRGATLIQTILWDSKWCNDDDVLFLELRDCANFRDADLINAQLQGTNLRGAQLQGAYLVYAHLEGANLSKADLRDAHLGGAHLQGANLEGAQLRGANLSEAYLMGVSLVGADLEGADLRFAQLQGADLSRSDLRGADLRKTAVWRALADSTSWYLADLRGMSMAKLEATDALIGEWTSGIGNEAQRDAVMESLTSTLRTAARSATPRFPPEWQSRPDVMFDPPPPDGWGRRSWASEQDYDKDLARFLGNLACSPVAPQPLGTSRRALNETVPRLDGDRLWFGLFAARVMGPSCPAARILPDHVRRELKQLAARSRGK